MESRLELMLKVWFCPMMSNKKSCNLYAVVSPQRWQCLKVQEYLDASNSADLPIGQWLHRRLYDGFLGSGDLQFPRCGLHTTWLTGCARNTTGATAAVTFDYFCLHFFKELNNYDIIWWCCIIIFWLCMSFHTISGQNMCYFQQAHLRRVLHRCLSWDPLLWSHQSRVTRWTFSACSRLDICKMCRIYMIYMLRTVEIESRDETAYSRQFAGP